MKTYSFKVQFLNTTYIDDIWTSGGWGELKNSPGVIVFHDDNLSAGEASFQDLILNITPGTQTHTYT